MCIASRNFIYFDLFVGLVRAMKYGCLLATHLFFLTKREVDMFLLLYHPLMQIFFFIVQVAYISCYNLLQYCRWFLRWMRYFAVYLNIRVFFLAVWNVLNYMYKFLMRTSNFRPLSALHAWSWLASILISCNLLFYPF